MEHPTVKLYGPIWREWRVVESRVVPRATKIGCDSAGVSVSAEYGGDTSIDFDPIRCSSNETKTCGALHGNAGDRDLATQLTLLRVMSSLKKMNLFLPTRA